MFIITVTSWEVRNISVRKIWDGHCRFVEDPFFPGPQNSTGHRYLVAKESVVGCDVVLQIVLATHWSTGYRDRWRKV